MLIERPVRLIAVLLSTTLGDAGMYLVECFFTSFMLHGSSCI